VGEDDDGPAWAELHVIDVASGRDRAFVSGEVNVSGVEWSAKGEEILFLSKRGDDEERALYVIPVDGGEARKAVSFEKASISSFDLAPDGERVVCIVSAPKDEELEKEKKKGFKQEIYEEDWEFDQVWIATLEEESSEARQLEIEGHVSAVDWSPVDDRILIARAPTPLVDDSYMRKRVAVIDGASGEVLASIENPGKLGHIAWSPDASWVTMIAGGDINDPNAGRLLLAPAAGGELVDLLPAYLGDAEDFAWQDADTLMFIADQGVWSLLEKVEITADGTGGERKTIVSTGGPILASLSLAADGQSGAFIADSPTHPPEVFFMGHGDEGPRRLTDSNPWLAEKRLAVQEVVQFEARDGVGLEGLLIRPLDEVEGRRYPLILCVHGGPEAHHSNGWLTSYSAPGQVGAARGFAVFYTNYRGSTGRGVEFSKLSQGDPAGKEFDDLVDAVDLLIDIGLVDTGKVGVTGGSYGGYATAWCSTRYSERFAAGVMFVGISNKISKVGTTDIPDEEFYVHARKRPWDDWQFMLERSPIFHADKSRTPLLILHGKDDPRVDPGQSRELYRHLKLRGQAPVRLVFYPGEGHGNRKAAARLDYNLRSLRWFEHYLQGSGGEAPAYELERAEPEQAVDEPAGASSAP
jgi:dipeptidyl aminopeptidase/acylaminoacyl peptidase